MPVKIILIRHGEAECNLYQDDELLERYNRDAPLTVLGRQQVQLLARYYPQHLCPFQAFSSPLRRAAETAQIFMQSYPGDVQYDQRLEEVLTPASFIPPLRHKEWDDLLEKRVRLPYDQIIPDLESLAQQYARFSQFLQDTIASARFHTQNILIFSHAFTIELALLYLLQLELSFLQTCRFKISNTALHVIEYDIYLHTRRIALINDRTHLNKITNSALREEAEQI